MTVEITIYGAEQKCASCVNLPSSKDTMEWLDAALSRKYPNDALSIRYVDIYEPATAIDKRFADAILNDVYFYPLIVIDEEVVAEGSPKLRIIHEKIDEKLHA
ncbi:YuzD family protein [Alkalihalobacillus sp. LMS39]|uniref:YuzD family protein n=1 Tax=Alkalihalobacillus sp. LMS39 TaxID=2924032 RepID=UPI001FB4548D|nr:YuzD family protein [Alkalihalobacillus sp. LMS39]UOE93656.1 YuzD family protein [Alkalihalobacillus sp. LMS39]